MFISKRERKNIWQKIDDIEKSANEALRRLTARIERIEETQRKDRADAAQKDGILLARIKASENGRFVYDDRTGKVLPVITGIGDAQRELAAEVIAKSIDESRAEYEKLLRHAEKATAPKRKAEPIADDEPALFTQAQREKVRRYYDLNFEILNALKIDRVKNGTPGTAVYLNRRKNGNSTACRFAEKHAPTYARFVNSMYDAGARISYILTAAADRGIIFTERGRARKSPRLYLEEEVVQVYQQAEKYISEHPEKFAEFIRDTEVAQC